MVFPVVMYGCESWTIKKAECQRIDAFELWCWRRLLRVPWTARRSNQSILKEISPEYSLEGLMLKLKLQYSGHLMQRTDSLEKTLMLGVSASSGSWWWTEKQFMTWCSPWGCKESDTTEQLNWAELQRRNADGRRERNGSLSGEAAGKERGPMGLEINELEKAKNNSV